MDELEKSNVLSDYQSDPILTADMGAVLDNMVLWPKDIATPGVGMMGSSATAHQRNR